MKALSIRPPWSWAIIYAGKDVENRCWSSKYRGPLLIHASKKFDTSGYYWMLEHQAVLGINVLPVPGEFKRGGIIGQVDMVACVKTYGSKWFFGEFGFVFKNPKPLPFYRYRGELNIFEVSKGDQS